LNIQKEYSMARKRNGRPSLLTKDRVKKITDAIAIGSSYDLAAKYAGISTPTIQNWLAQGRRLQAMIEAGKQMKDFSSQEKKLLSFLKDVEEASAEAGIKWQQVVEKAAKIDPAMALHMLNLRFGGYSRNQVQFTANIDLARLNLTEGQLTYIAINGLTDEQILRLNSGENPANIIPSADPSAGAAPEVPEAEDTDPGILPG
jgi:hypothetical protein